MLAYIVRRLMWIVVLLFTILLLTFVVFSVLPAGDPAVQRAGRQPSPQLVESIRAQLGLDKSKPAQFYCYIADVLPLVANKMSGQRRCNPVVEYKRAGPGGVLHLLEVPKIQWSTEGKLGSYFGFSYQNNADILPQILSRIPTTIALSLGAVVVWLLVGIPVGMLSALKTGTLIDRISMGTALIFISAPVYFFGLVSLYLFSDDIGKFKIFPGNSALQEATSLPGKAFALTLPWLVLASAYAAVYARFLRGNLIDVLSEDYIRTARAKGLRERTVIFKHGVRSAVTPIVTLLGLDIGLLLGGAILTETVFNIQGIGRYAFDAINRQDLPVIQGTVLFGALFIVTLSLVVDIVYAFLDPRVRY